VSQLDFRQPRPRFLRLHLTNFLSYRSAVLEFGDLVALVGPNASGKSNAVAAIKLLREIPFHGLPTAIARRGGFDQLRHRSLGHPYNPALRLDFIMPGAEQESYYELRLSAVAGKRYEVKQERADIRERDSRYKFTNMSGLLTWTESLPGGEQYASPADRPIRVPPGQSGVSGGGPSYASYILGEVLQSMQTVEINPARVGDLQEPSSTREFEPDGSNTASIFETMEPGARTELIDELSAIVPGLDRIELRRLADKVTLAFYQDTGKGRREFLAKQMSDGTLRAFSVLLAMLQPARPALLVIEEPEIAIHLGALRTLVDILQQQSAECQVLITTHSADIIDTLDIDDLRVVWSDGGASNVAPVAPHTREPVRRGLITPGELLRSDALDPAST
jgi:predicted ATPase